MSKATKDNVQKMVDDQYIEDVRLGLCSRSCWKITGDVCETMGQVLVCFSAAVSYAAAAWPHIYLSYAAGTITVIGIAFHRFGIYARGESKERTEETNKLLASNNITPLIDIATQENEGDTVPSAIPSNIPSTTAASSTVL